MRLAFLENDMDNSSFDARADFPQLSAAQQPSGCRSVESFGLNENSTRILQYAPLHKQVQLSVGEITPNQAFTLVLTNLQRPPNQEWRINKAGEVNGFSFDRSRYVVVIKTIYRALLGTDAVEVEIGACNES